MKTVLTLSKYVTRTYYGDPVDHCTMTLMVSDQMPPEAVEIAKENMRRELEAMPVESFPVAGDHATLLPEYAKRHPKKCVR
jgi:hypothetical protein